MKILITEPANYAAQALSLYRQCGLVHEASDTRWMHGDSEVNVLVVRLAHTLNAAVLTGFPRLRYIVTPTTGHDHIDESYCAQHGIAVLSLRGETEFLQTIPATAEHTIALMLALLRKLPGAVHHVAQGLWNRNEFLGEEAAGKALGILGMGRIGRQVAKIGLALGMAVRYYDTDPGKVFDGAIACSSQQQLFESADIISLHIPHNKYTHKCISASMLQHMKPNAVLINTSRGGIIDEQFLAQAIQAHRLGGYATDVLAMEHDTQDAQYSLELIDLMVKGYPIVITPHIAGATGTSMRKTEIFMAEKFLRLKQ